jgi:hypothetical protein
MIRPAHEIDIIEDLLKAQFDFRMEQHRTIHSHALFTWTIPHTKLCYFDSYYLLHWRTEHFFKQPMLAMIDHQGIEYTVSYYKCLPGNLMDYDEILLSFRRIKGETRGYVLVRPKYGTEVAYDF